MQSLSHSWDQRRPQQDPGSITEKFTCQAPACSPRLFSPFPSHDDPGLHRKGNARALLPSKEARQKSGCGSPPATALRPLRVFIYPSSFNQSWVEAALSSTTAVGNAVHLEGALSSPKGPSEQCHEGNATKQWSA